MKGKNLKEFKCCRYRHGFLIALRYFTEVDKDVGKLVFAPTNFNEINRTLKILITVRCVAVVVIVVALHFHMRRTTLDDHRQNRMILVDSIRLHIHYVNLFRCNIYHSDHYAMMSQLASTFYSRRY